LLLAREDAAAGPRPVAGIPLGVASPGK
jgi:hypothetical protein